MPQSRSAKRFVLDLVELESRVVPSSATIRIATYNIEADINGVTTPRAGLYQVLEGIGEEQLQGDVQPVDIVTLEETTSNSTTVAPILSNLNSFYNGLANYAQSPYQATQNGANNGGNGPNALIYNTDTLTLLASVGIGTPGGSSNGEYRQVVRYEFQPVWDTGSAGIFYVYVSHMKSGTTSADATDRGEEATIIRNDEATLPASASVLYTGDLNSAPPEQEFTVFTGSGQGEAYDPVNFSTSVQYYSESSTDLRYRDDYELMTSNVLNDTGPLEYVSGTLHSFANNGTTPSGGSVNSGSDTALNSDLVQDGSSFISAATLYSDLTTASDHLPVVADYTLPYNSTTTTVTSTPASPIDQGTSIAFTAAVSGSPSVGTVTFYAGPGLTNQIGSPVNIANGSATSSATTTLPVGTDTITAVYSGGTGFNGSQGTESVVVNPNGFTTTTTLADSGPNPSLAGVTDSFSGTVTSSSGNPISGEKVNIEDASNSNSVVATPTITNGVFSFALSNLSVGTHDLFAVYGGDATNGGSQSPQVAQTIQSTFQVANSAATPNGVVFTFNAPIDATTAHLYNSTNGSLGAPDVTVVGASTGSVEGSLVIDPTHPYIATFLRTAGPLATDQYIATVTTAVKAVGGSTLSGNYTNTLSATASTSPTLTVPSFARGAGQAVNVPNTSSGLPVTIANASSVTAVSFTLTYDPTLLTIAASRAIAPSSAAAAAGLTNVSYSIAQIDSNHNVLTVAIGGGSGWNPANGAALLSIAATVPNGAGYANKGVLSLAGVSVNGVAGTGVSGVDVAAYIGDVAGNRNYSSQDAFLIDQVEFGAATGFAFYKDLDPVIVGDIAGTGSITSQDAFLVNEEGLGITVPQIPSIPSGVTPPTGGPDPELYFPNFEAAPGQTIQVELMLKQTNSTPIQIADLDEAIEFNPAIYTVSNVQTGSLLKGFTTGSNVNNAQGWVRVSQFALNPLDNVAPGTIGAVLDFDVTVNAKAKPGEETPLNLAQSATSNGTTTFTDAGSASEALTLSPAPTNGSHDSVDGKITVTRTPVKVSVAADLPPASEVLPTATHDVSVLSNGAAAKSVAQDQILSVASSEAAKQKTALQSDVALKLLQATQKKFDLDELADT